MEFTRTNFVGQSMCKEICNLIRDFFNVNFFKLAEICYSLKLFVTPASVCKRKTVKSPLNSFSHTLFTHVASLGFPLVVCEFHLAIEDKDPSFW
jgi:hypothetical protein